MFDFRGNKVCSQMRCNISHSGVGYEANSLDVLVMFTNETEVGHDGSEVVPSREFRSLDDQTGENPALFNIWINRFRDLQKVVLLERGLGPYIQNRVSGVEIMFDHLLLLPALLGVSRQVGWNYSFSSVYSPLCLPPINHYVRLSDRFTGLDFLLTYGVIPNVQVKHCFGARDKEFNTGLWPRIQSWDVDSNKMSIQTTACLDGHERESAVWRLTVDL